VIEETVAEIAPVEMLRGGLVLLALGAPLAWIGLRWLQAQPTPLRAESPPRPRDLLLAFPLFILGGLLAGMLVGSLYPQEGRPVLADLTAVALSLVPLIVFGVTRARMLGSLRSLGLDRPTPRHVLVGLGSWLLFLPTIMALMWMSPWLFEAMGGEWTPQAWGGRIEGITGAHAIGVVLITGLVVPFFEELIFRGWLQQGLAAIMGARPAILFVAVVFALVHDVGTVLPIFALALLLGTLRERTQSLWPSVAVHVVHNSVQVVWLRAYAP